MSIGGGNGPRPQERHPSTAILKDGTQLKGFVSVEFKSKNHFQFVFNPIGVQSDGNKWMTRAQLGNATGPKNLRILESDAIKTKSLKFTDPTGDGLEPAMLKIMLGLRYFGEGRKLVQSIAFDKIRSSLRGSLHSSITTRWIDPANNGLLNVMPFEIQKTQHLTWEECEDGQTYSGGICLFARLCMTVRVSDFGLHIPPSQCLISNGESAAAAE